MIEGQKVLVSEEVYRAYTRPLWRERKGARRRALREVSLERLNEKGYDIEDEGEVVDEIATDRVLLETLAKALERLTVEERELIGAFFNAQKSERDIADALHITHQAVNKRKRRIFEKLRGILGI
jgi:RNA polymerase sigma factor (sigma-70 family)